MANKPSHTAAAWTEVEYSSLCISPYLSTPVFVPKETSFYLCREDGERSPGHRPGRPLGLTEEPQERTLYNKTALQDKTGQKDNRINFLNIWNICQTTP